MAVGGTYLEPLSRRLRMWLRTRKKTVERLEGRTRARYAETRGAIAEFHGDETAARRHFARGLGHRRSLHLPEAAMADTVRLARFERERGLLGNADDRLQEARQICAEADPTDEFLEEVVALRRAYEDRDDRQSVAEWFFTEIYLARAVESDFHARRPERHRTYLEITAGPQTIPNVYDLALRNLLYGDDELAGECLLELVSRRDSLQPGTEGFVLVLAGAVGLLAHHEIGGVDLPAEERERLEKLIEAEADRLSESATALWNVLRDGNSDFDLAPEEQVDPADIRVSLGQLEASAFALLADRLSGEQT